MFTSPMIALDSNTRLICVQSTTTQPIAIPCLFVYARYSTDFMMQDLYELCVQSEVVCVSVKYQSNKWGGCLVDMKGRAECRTDPKVRTVNGSDVSTSK
jgi:hypothetical protein